MKRRYDVGTDLKPAKASIRFSLYPHRTAPDDLDLMPFLSPTSQDDLQEVEEDLVNGSLNLTPFGVISAI